MTWWQILLTIWGPPLAAVGGIALAALLRDHRNGPPRTLH